MLRNLTAKETKRILKIAKAINAGYSFKNIETGNYYLATDLTNDLTEFTDQQLEKIIDNSKNIYQCIATEIETEEKETIDKSRAETINETLTAAITGRLDTETRNQILARADIYLSDLNNLNYLKNSAIRSKEFIISLTNILRKETDTKQRKKLVSEIIYNVNWLNSWLTGYNKDLIKFKAFIDNETIKLTELLNNSADPVKLIDINNILTATEIALVNKETKAETKAKKETKKPEKNKFSDIVNFETANNKLIELARIETETNSLVIIADQKLKIAIRSGKDQLTIEKLYKNLEKLNSKLTEIKADISYLSEIRFNFARNR